MPISPARATELGDLIDAALVTQWEQSGRGFARGRVTTEQEGELDGELMMGWDGERVGYQYLKYEHDRNPPVAGKPPRQQNPLWTGCWSPKEHWQYDPARHLAIGLGGRFHRALDDALDLRPRNIWFGFLLRGKPTHIETFRQMRAHSQIFETPAGNAVIHNERGELEFSIAHDYRVIRHELTHPNNPLRVSYELARDLHGLWYPHKVVYTEFQKNSRSKIRLTRTIEIDEYTSRPAPHQLKLTVNDLGIPDGTTMIGQGTSRRGTWIKGVVDESSVEHLQRQLNRLIEESRSHGFSAKSREKQIP